MSQSDVFGQLNDDLIQSAFTEGFLDEEHVSYDATHFEVRDASKSSEKKEKAPKKRGRKSKEEREDSLCQKAYKIKCETDIRKYTYPAKGSTLWKKLYKARTAIERVNAYLKEYFQLSNVRHRTGRKAKLHFQLVTFIYNACKLAVDRMNVYLQAQPQVA